MNKRNFLTFGIAFVFALAPFLLFIYIDRQNRNVFHQRLDENYERCRKRLNSDEREIKWCDEIRESAKLSHKDSDRIHHYLLLIWISPLVAYLLASNFGLRERISELLEKENA